MDVRKFEYAAKDKTTGLTMAALLGERKQSTQDAEKLLYEAIGVCALHRRCIN